MKMFTNEGINEHLEMNEINIHFNRGTFVEDVEYERILFGLMHIVPMSTGELTMDGSANGPIHALEKG
jgi:hypothetical protein